MRMNTLTLFGFILSGVAALLIYFGQKQSSDSDKRDIITELKDVQKERNELRRDLEKRDEEIKDQSVTVISLQNQLIEKSNRLNDFLTGGDGYPIVRVTFENKGPQSKFIFEICNETSLPLRSIRATVFDYTFLKNSIDRTNPDKQLLPYGLYIKSQIYIFQVPDLIPDGKVLSRLSFNDTDGLYFVQIISLNSIKFQKIASAIVDNHKYFGYAIVDDKDAVEKYILPDVSEKVNTALKERLKSISVTEQYSYTH